MSDRGLKNRTPISSTIEIRLYEQLDKLTQQTRIPKSKLLDEAIQDLLKKYNK